VKDIRGKLAEVLRRGLRLSQKSERDERVCGEQIEGDRAVARMIHDAVECAASGFGQRGGKCEGRAGRLSVFADAVA
jgi:hypothetical protein